MMLYVPQANPKLLPCSHSPGHMNVSAAALFLAMTKVAPLLSPAKAQRRLVLQAPPRAGVVSGRDRTLETS